LHKQLDLNSTVGIDLQNTNPVAYAIIMEHYMAHQAQAALMMEAQAQEQEQADNSGNSDSEPVQ